MSGIFGTVRWDGAPVEPGMLSAMRSAMAHWGADGSAIWSGGCAALSQLRLFTTPESHRERLPIADAASGIVFTAAARIDNRRGLLLALRIDDAGISDGELLFQAYLRWGVDCAKRVYGDWSFAAWHSAEQTMQVARDHLGVTSLYWYADDRLFAFASDRRALLAMGVIPLELDELYLAQILVSWPANHDGRTVVPRLRRLRPAHTLRVTPERLTTSQYWDLDAVPERRLPTRAEYVEGFRDVFDEAVRTRLRADRPVAAMLSGGLDSGAVTASAARILAAEGARLNAFTAVPFFDTAPYTGTSIGDELPLARATAQHAGNVTQRTVDGSRFTPIGAIRYQLEILDEPMHAAGNYFWMLDLSDQVRELGCRVLLSGQAGNGGISWSGDMRSQSFGTRLRRQGLRALTRERLAHAKRTGARMLPSVADAYRGRPDLEEWARGSAIHPDYARRLDIRGKRRRDPAEAPDPSPRQRRSRILKPGRSHLGALHAISAAFFGIEIRDPTADARVLEFVLSVPDRVFIDPNTGTGRWLVREAMRGRLPDEVRLNRRRGRQAGDLVPRLRATADEVEAALDEIAGGRAGEYIDIPYMRETWRLIQARDTPEARFKAIAILTRGLMVGLWVNQQGR